MGTIGAVPGRGVGQQVKARGEVPFAWQKSLRGEAVLEASLIKEGNCLKVDKVVDIPGQGQKHGCGLDRGVEGQWNPHRARRPCREKPRGGVHRTWSSAHIKMPS